MVMPSPTPGKRERIRLLVLLLAWKALFLLIVFGAIALFPGRFNEDAYWANFHWPEDQPPSAWTSLQTWDAQHYLYLAENGYSGAGGSAAFFPLWPLLVRTIAPLFGGSVLWSGIVLANLLSIVGMMLFYGLARAHLGSRRTADTSLLLILACPGALFLSFVYPESLFLCLALLMISALLRGRWWTAVAASFFMPLTQGVGLFAVLPLLYDQLARRRETGRIVWSRLSGALAPLAGFATYLLWMKLQTGDPFLGIRTQLKFTTLARYDLPRFLDSIFHVGTLDEALLWVADKTWFVLLIACLVPLWRSSRTMFFYALGIGAAPVLTEFTSCTRSIVVVFPVFLVLGEVLGGERRRLDRGVVLAAFAALQVLLVARHVRFDWLG